MKGTPLVQAEIDLARAKETFRSHGATLRMAEALRLGLNRTVLYELVRRGDLNRLSRGLYRLADALTMEDPDVVSIARRIPDGVICLISALAFHGLTTEIPHEVYVAVNRSVRTWVPRVDYPPVRVFWFSASTYAVGGETHTLDATEVRIYNREKTIADCFKFRNKVGLDVALEALKFYRRAPGFDVETLTHYARVCRVANVMRPYLEALL